nr:guanine nucleotide exchange factor spike 1 [Quercus suber]
MNTVDAIIAKKKKKGEQLDNGYFSQPSWGWAASPKYSDRLSPAVNNYLSEASRQEVRPLPPVPTTTKHRPYLRFRPPLGVGYQPNVVLSSVELWYKRKEELDIFFDR